MLKLKLKMNKCDKNDTSAPTLPTPRPSTLELGKVDDDRMKRAGTPPPAPLSDKTLDLIQKYDTLDEEDLFSRAEQLERVDTEPIPQDANKLPGGMEVDSDCGEEENDINAKK